MDIQSTTVTTEQTTVVIPDTSDATDVPVESATLCPSCNYTGDSEFLTCPRCGLIIKKYFKLQSQRTDAPQLLATETDAAAASSRSCGTTPRSSGNVLLVLCLLAGVILGVILYRAGTHSPLSGPSTPDVHSKTEPSNPAAPTTPSLVTNAPSDNLTTALVFASPTNPSEDMPHTLPNHLGITVKRIIFASDVDDSNMPVNDLARVPFNGKKIVVRIKMEIVPEKSYQFTGKFFDGDGKLVMNVTSPTNPTLSVWYAWYYHNLDRADDKPGIWKFVFLVNGEQILERQIEVVDQ